MAKYTSNEVLDLLFEKPANEDDIDEDDSEDDFYGYDNTVRGMMIQQDESIVDNGGLENEFGDIDEQSDSPMSEESLPLPELHCTLFSSVPHIPRSSTLFVIKHTSFHTVFVTYYNSILLSISIYMLFSILSQRRCYYYIIYYYLYTYMLFFINNIYIHILNVYYYIKYAYRIQSQTSAIWAHKRRTHAMRSHLK